MASINELFEQLSSGLASLASAIRAKTGKTDTLGIEDMATEQDAVFEAGKKAERIEMWSAVQNGGLRENYPQCFASAFNERNFYPAFDFNVKNGLYMFRSFAFNGDLDQRLKDCGVVLNTENISNANGLFNYASSVTKLPHLVLTSPITLSLAFQSMIELKSLEVTFGRETSYSDTFHTCKALENLLVHGTIGQNGFKVSDSTKLTHDSLMSIINCLEAKTSGTWTVTLGTTNLAKLTDAEKAIATQKGWTLA